VNLDLGFRGQTCEFSFAANHSISQGASLRNLLCLTVAALALSTNAAFAWGDGDWSGLYAGANVGGAWTRNHWTDDFEKTSISTDTASGVTGGGQIGTDFQVEPNWVIGAQGSFDGGTLGSDVGQNVSCGGCGLVDHSRESWLATVTARVGFLVQPNLLVYAKAGGAWTHDRYTETETLGYFATTGTTRSGYVAGGGIEWAFARSLSIFVEYDHVDFGDFTTQDLGDEITVGQSGNSVLAGVNFHI
jgi:outer membrane immunogenic protein